MGFSSYGYRTVSESAIDNEVPLYLSGQNKQAVARVAPPAGEGGLDVYADEVIQEHAGGKIARFGFGPQASPTWVLDVTSAGMAATYLDKGGTIYNARAYAAGGPLSVGVAGTGTADSTALAATIAAAKAGSLTIGEARMSRILVPAGRWNISEPIDLDGLVGCQFTGDGMEATVFGLATGTGTNTAAWWSTRSMMSAVGTNFCRYEGFTLYAPLGASAPVPQCGLLLGQNNAFTNWVGSAVPANIANRAEVYSVRTAGQFSKAGHVNYAVPSSIYQSCDFSRNKSQNVLYPNGQTIDEAALVLSRQNEVGVGQAGSVPLMPPGPAGSCSDLTFLDVEVHDNCQEAGTFRCICPAVWMEAAHDISMIGGNWLSGASGSAPASGAPACGYWRLSMSPGGGTGPRNIVIENIHWYVEGGVLAPDIGMRLTSDRLNSAHVLRSHVEGWTTNAASEEINHPGPAIVASDITIRNCQVMISGPGLISGGPAGAAGATVANFMRWKIENVKVMDGTTGYLNQKPIIFFGGVTTGLFTDCSIECAGMQITGNGSSWVRGELKRPGPIYGMTVSHGEFEIHGGGALALAAGGTGYYGQTANATQATAIPIRLPQGCVLFNLRVAVNVAPEGGAGTQALTCTLQKAAPTTTITYVDSAVVATISETSVGGANTTDFTGCAAGDLLLLKVVASAGAAASAWVSWSVSGINT